MLELLQRWPGKSATTDDGIAHPAPYHFLDVAAVAERLVERMNFDPALGEALVLLAGLHDLGKIGDPFKAMLERGQPQTTGTHWEVTEAYLRHFDPELLGPRLGGSEDARKALYAAAAGHHGRPPWRDLPLSRSDRPAGDWKRMLDAAGAQAIVDAAAVTRAFVDLWPKASLAGVADLAEAQVLSWRLAGLTTAADWIASNPGWFPPTAPGPNMSCSDPR